MDDMAKSKESQEEIKNLVNMLTGSLEKSVSAARDGHSQEKTLQKKVQEGRLPKIGFMIVVIRRWRLAEN